jgi:hypothetical protein
MHRAARRKVVANRADGPDLLELGANGMRRTKR